MAVSPSKHLSTTLTPTACALSLPLSTASEPFPTFSLPSSTSSQPVSSTASRSSVHSSHQSATSAPVQARLLLAYSKVPLCTLILQIPVRYVMSKDNAPWQHPRGHCIPFKVRIMGSAKMAPAVHHRTRDDATSALVSTEDMYRTSADSEIFIVAKDVCTLIHTSKGNVSKSVGGFTEWERARMAVLCPRYNSSVSTHVLTVLSIAGVDRLLNTSRSPLAPAILKVLHTQIDTVLDEQAKVASDEGDATAVAGAAIVARAAGDHPSSLPSLSTDRPPGRLLFEPVPLAASFLSSTSDLSSLPAASDLPLTVTVSKRKQTGDLDDEGVTLQVSGPTVVCSLVLLGKGLVFVMLEEQDSARLCSDLMRACEVGKDALGESQTSRTGTRLRTGPTSGLGTLPQRSAAVRSAVVVPVNGYVLSMATSPSVSTRSDEQREPKRQRQCDDRSLTDDVRWQRPSNETLGPSQSTTIPLQPPTTTSSPSLLVEQASTATSNQQLRRTLYDQLQHQQQQLLISQQQQQHDLNEMIMVVQHQQQQQFTREQQLVQHLVSTAGYHAQQSLYPLLTDASLCTSSSLSATSQSPFTPSSAAPYSQPAFSTNLSTNLSRLSSSCFQTSSPVPLKFSASPTPAPAQPPSLSMTPSFASISPIVPLVDCIPRTPMQPFQPAPINWTTPPSSDRFDHAGSFNDPYQGDGRYGGY